MNTILIPAILFDRFKLKYKNSDTTIITYQINEKLTEEFSNLFDIIIVFPFEIIDSNFLEHFIKAKEIIIAGTGTENINYNHAKSIKTKIINLHDINTSAIIEWIIHNIISYKRNFAETYLNTSLLNQFDKLEYCNEIKSKFTIGFLGCNNITTGVLKTLSSINQIDYLVYDPYITKKTNLNLVSSINELFIKSSIVIVCVPLTKQTKYLITSKSFKNTNINNSIISTSKYDIINWDEIANNDITFNFIALDCLPNEYDLLKTCKIIGTDIGINRMKDKSKSIILSSNIASYSPETLDNITLEIEGHINNIWNCSNYNKACLYKQKMKQSEYIYVPRTVSKNNIHSRNLELRKYIELQI